MEFILKWMDDADAWSLDGHVTNSPALPYLQQVPLATTISFVVDIMHILLSSKSSAVTFKGWLESRVTAFGAGSVCCH